ncbi:MAG: TorF family putative porin, partial [Gammaproteobacteria bacterium]|nr:TorF family putative porin [Gammaproteobacteria bacterium]
VLATAVASVLTSGIAAAELTANAAISSNYIWRGITQTNDQAAGMGGVDWSGDSGLYVGTWVSNVAFGGSGNGGYEMDVYAGYGGEVGGFGYDLGVISYQYPVDPSNWNFTEVYASGSMVGVTVGLWYTVDKAAGLEDPAGNDDDIYLYGSYDFSASDIDYSVYIGNYDFDACDTCDYTHYGASIGKDGFGFAVDQNDLDGDVGNVRFTVSYSKDFAL